MTSQPVPPEIPSSFRFEFDRVDKFLLLRVEGRLTEELFAELYKAIRKYSVATNASAGIWDMSSVTKFELSSEFLRELAKSEPAMPNATKRPRFIVATDTFGFGLMRMFQMSGERTRSALKVVYTLDEAFAELGVQSPHFEPLE
jgi:hypothetical protein